MTSQAANAVCKRGDYDDNTRNVHLLGISREFENLDGLSSDAALLDQRKVRMKYVRNSSGGTLYAGQVVSWITGYSGKRVTNPGGAAGDHVCGVVDWLYGSAGVPDGKHFWMIESGSPCKFRNDAAGAIQEFDRIVVSASIAGCVREQTAAPTQGNEIAQVNGLVGIAEAAADAGGGTIANATLFYGFFKPIFCT